MERSNNLVGATRAEAPNKSEFKIAELNTACFFAHLDAVTEHPYIHVENLWCIFSLFICIVYTVHHLRFIYNECQRGRSYLRCCKLCLSARTKQRLPTHPSPQETHFENNDQSTVCIPSNLLSYLLSIFPDILIVADVCGIFFLSNNKGLSTLSWLINHYIQVLFQTRCLRLLALVLNKCQSSVPLLTFEMHSFIHLVFVVKNLLSCWCSFFPFFVSFMHIQTCQHSTDEKKPWQPILFQWQNINFELRVGLEGLVISHSVITLENIKNANGTV